jgi:GDPmannose 4,6-dehydratase
MWRMLQQPEPDDYVVATGEAHSVREFVEIAFRLCGITIEWKGKGLKEKGLDAATGRQVVGISPEYFRPVEVPYLRGDPTKARTILGWEPQVGFEALVRMMVAADLRTLGLGVPFDAVTEAKVPE